MISLPSVGCQRNALDKSAIVNGFLQTPGVSACQPWSGGCCRVEGLSPVCWDTNLSPVWGGNKKGREENMGKEGEVGRQIGELRLSDGPKFSLCSLESSPEKKVIWRH